MLGPAHTGWIKPKHLIFKNHHYGSFLVPSTPHNFSSRIDHPSQHLAITAKFVVTLRRSWSYRPTLGNLAPQCEHLNTFSCAVSPPLILSSMWCYVRCPHPSVNIWTHFLVQCPPLILSSMWCYVRCPSLILNSMQCPNLFVCAVFRPKSILELYHNSSFNIWHDTLKWNVNLAQLVSSSVALPAKLVL